MALPPHTAKEDKCRSAEGKKSHHQQYLMTQQLNIPWTWRDVQMTALAGVLAYAINLLGHQLTLPPVVLMTLLIATLGGCVGVAALSFTGAPDAGMPGDRQTGRDHRDESNGSRYV